MWLLDEICKLFEPKTTIIDFVDDDNGGYKCKERKVSYEEYVQNRVDSRMKMLDIQLEAAKRWGEHRRRIEKEKKDSERKKAHAKAVRMVMEKNPGCPYL